VRRQEFPNHTDEQIDDYLRRALEILRPWELSETERAAVLPVLVTLCSAKQIVFEQPAMMPGQGMLLPNARGH